MTDMIFQLLGGIGLFLMGMVLLTDGLKTMAGDALRRTLVQFTGTPTKAFASGTLVTALVQSSSATTVTVIGFVSAGLITFPQAIGVVMGASLGTTATGWIVSVVGLKISLGFYALPLIGAGAFLRLLGHGKWRSLGLAVAGFGLIFIGIDTLQLGMQNLAVVFDLGALPTGWLLGPILAVSMGAVLTVVMQSSSAAVATILTALHSQAIHFDQAAALIIGAAIGTTVTGALAAIGSTIPAKRTALAHVVFNSATGFIALVLLPLFLMVISILQQNFGIESGAISLALFHTLFILVGVIAFLPFTKRFSALVIKLIPDQGPSLTRHLDDTLLNIPPVALEATRRALSQITCEIFRVYLNPKTIINENQLRDIDQGLTETQRFFSKIPAANEDEPYSELHVAQMHAIDHITRLTVRMRPPENLLSALNHPRLQPAYKLCQELLQQALSGLCGNSDENWLEKVSHQSQKLGDIRKNERPAILKERVTTDRDPALALELLDAIRWIDRVSYHTWRACYYLSLAEGHEQRSPITLTDEISREA